MTTQMHYGSGDNVENKYEYIIRSIKAQDLKSVAENIMHDIRHRETSRAREKIGVINNIGSLESEVKTVLECLLIKTNLIDNSLPSESSRQEILYFLHDRSNSDYITSVVMSILIDLESRTQPSLAHERYNSITEKSSHVIEVYLERLATESDIKEHFNSSNRIYLLEDELCGLVRGALRVHSFKLALEICTHLHDVFPSSNSQILLLICESYLLLSQGHSKHIWTLDRSVKIRVDRLIVQVSNMIDTQDARLAIVLINLLKITLFSDTDLIIMGQKHADKISTFDSDISDKINRALLSKSFKKSELDFSQISIDFERYLVLIDALKRKTIKGSIVEQWINQGGSIDTGESYVNSFYMLYLKALIHKDGDNKKIVSLVDEANKLLQLNDDLFIQLPPLALIELSDLFIDMDCPLLAVDYLSPMIPKEPWASPLFECYLRALVASEKHQLFLSQVALISPEEKTSFVWLLEAQVHERLNQYQYAINASRSAIALDPDDHFAWNLLLFTLRNSGVNVDERKKILRKIPDSIFLKFHETKLSLISEIASFVDINFAEKVLVDWFVKAPEIVAKPLTQIHVSSLSNRPEITENPYTPEYCGDGITYSDGFKTYNRIIVKNLDVTHPSLLDAESPTGKILDSMKEGETINDPIYGEFTVIERLSPYIAAFRHAIELRDRINDGTDVFKLYTVPDSEDEFIPYFEKILKALSEKDRKKHDVLRSDKIPLTMRGRYTAPDNPIKGAVTHLTSADSTQYIALYDDGIKKPSKVVIDLYTAVYFSLMGFSTYLSNSSVEIVISEQSKKFYEHWLSDILREDYLAIEYTDDGMRKYTHKDIKQNSFQFINELKALMSVVRVESLIPSDTPNELVSIRDMIDGTVYSTFQLSVANNIPWLCIDHVMCMLAKQSNYPTVNINSFVIDVVENISLNAKLQSIKLNLFAGTPVPILYSDVIELSLSSIPEHVYLVAKFIEKYGASFQSPQALQSFMLEVTGKATVMACLEGSILKGGRCYNSEYDGYAENVFNHACHTALSELDGDTAEKRLALFIFNLLLRHGHIKNYPVLISLLASSFARGHFLDIPKLNCHMQELQDMVLSTSNNA